MRANPNRDYGNLSQDWATCFHKTKVGYSPHFGHSMGELSKDWCNPVHSREVVRYLFARLRNDPVAQKRNITMNL